DTAPSEARRGPQDRRVSSFPASLGPAWLCSVPALEHGEAPPHDLHVEVPVCESPALGRADPGVVVLAHALEVVALLGAGADMVDPPIGQAAGRPALAVEGDPVVAEQ